MRELLILLVQVLVAFAKLLRPVSGPVSDFENFHDYEEERPRDPAVDLAIERVRVFFNASPHRLFYST